MARIFEACEGGTRIRVKAVPGAKREEIVGPLGDRLKVRVSQPPEGGRANRAIEALLASALGVKPSGVNVVSGETRAEKTVFAPIAPAAAAAKLGLLP